MSRVAFVVHTGRPEAVAVATSLSKALQEKGVATRRLPTEPIVAEEVASLDVFAEEVDLIVSVGGDGTFLRSAQIANAQGCPLVGVNRRPSASWRPGECPGAGSGRATGRSSSTAKR